MGFNPRLAPYSHTHLFEGTTPGANEIFTIFRFPTQGKVLDAWATDTAGIAATTNTVALHLLKASSATLPVMQGTLGSWAAGTMWVADTPRQMTMTSLGSTALFAAGEWVTLSYVEATTGTWTEMGFQMDYVLGYDTGSAPTAATGPA